MAKAPNPARTSADTIRHASPPVPGDSVAGGTVAARTAMEFLECILEILLTEVGPQRVDKDQLGIGRLPEKEITDPLFAAGANDDVRIGYPCGREVRLEHGLVDVTG